MKKFIRIYVIAILMLSISKQAIAQENVTELLNVSYDPTRELYQDFNLAFGKYWKAQTGQELTIKQSHGGSSKQARAIIDGLEADVATLALAYDIDVLSEKGGIIPKDWQKRLPHNSTPFTSTIVFLVRKGNPNAIKDWNDLIRIGISVITANPKTSGGARWNYLAAWAYALKKLGGETQALDFIEKLYKNVPVLDSGARGSTTTFAQRGIGDVLVTWENEAFLAINEFETEQFEIVRPSLSILAEPPVAVVEKYADKHGTRKLAQAYLEYLYSDVGQEIAAKHFYRPRNEKIAARFEKQFPSIELVTIDDIFGGWSSAQEKHFSDGGIFDKIYAAQ